MKRISDKRRKRIAQAKPIRDALLKRVARCEKCGHDPRKARRGAIAWRLDVHEIARGPARDAALDQPSCLLVLCRPCHDEIHEHPHAWLEERQLALLATSRPEDVDLKTYNEVKGLGPTRITLMEVQRWQ